MSPMTEHAARRSVGVAVLVILLAACIAVPGASPTPSASLEPPQSASGAASATARPTPSPSASPTSTPTATPTITPGTPSPTASPTPLASVFHTVVAGESLSSIALRYATTWQSLVFWNRDRYPGLDPDRADYDPNRIASGWQLLVWPGVVVPFDAPLPTPPPTEPSSLLLHGSRSGSAVALTFDLGGRTTDAVAIVTWLRDHGVPATIFVTGASVDASPAARQVIGLVNANSGLFDLGNHSYSHPYLTTITVAQVTDEVLRAERAIAAHATQPTRPLFRPPYGAWDADVLAGVGAAGYAWSVMWDVDTIDWKPIGEGGPTASQIVAKVVARAAGGSIVLMHLGGYETLAALPGIVDGLRARGLEPVTLDALLGR